MAFHGLLQRYVKLGAGCLLVSTVAFSQSKTSTPVINSSAMAAAIKSGGALPKGQASQTPPSMTMPVIAPPEPACASDLLNPPGSNGSFSRDGLDLYLMADTTPKAGEPLRLRQATKAAPPLPRHTLYKINLATQQAEALLSLNLRQDPLLVIHGEPPQGLTAVAYLAGKQAPGCNSGPAGLVSISLAQNGAKAVRDTGIFWMIRTPTGHLLADAQKARILEIDTVSFQTRAKRQLQPEERPLYFDPEKNELATYKAADRVLRVYKGEQGGVAPLKLKVGDLLAQSANLFAVVQLQALKNTLTLVELPKWTAVTKAGKSILELPEAYSVKLASLDFHAATRRALVFGATPVVKRQWQRAFIFDYGQQKLLSTVTVAADEFINFSAIDRHGERAVFEVRSLANGRTVAVKVFDFKNNYLSDISLPIPPTDRRGTKGKTAR